MGQSENVAAPEDRLLLRTVLNGPADQFSLQNCNTAVLPQGCLAWADDVKSLYALDKTSSLAAQTDQVIVPASGPGRWLRVVTGEVSGGSVAMVSTSTNTFGFDGNWGQATSTSFSLDNDSADHPNWTLTALGGILTYTGPTRPFIVSTFADVEVGNAGSPRVVFAVVSKNNDMTGAAAPGPYVVETTCEVAGTGYSLANARRVVMSSGDTLRQKYAVAAGAVALAAELTMIVAPA